MTDQGWVFSALLCKHCDRVIYGHQSLRDSVRRSVLAMGARKAGGVQSGDDWFCCRGCRTAHQISPGIKTHMTIKVPRR